MANFRLANRAALPMRGLPSRGVPTGGIAGRGMMGGKGAPGGGPQGGLAGRVAGVMGGGVPPGATVRAMPGDMRDKLRGGAGLAQRDFETYQGAMTPRAAARDYAAFQSADQAAGAQADPSFTQRIKGALGGISGQPEAGAPGAPQVPQNLSQRLSGAGMGLLMSDRQSKERIRELENELEHTYAALEGGRAEYPTPTAPDTEALDRAYQRPSASSYEYRDPEAPGAGRGRFTGPMSDELRGIPGVVKPGPDGLDRIDEPRLTMANASQIGTLTRNKADRAEIEDLRSQLEALGDKPDAVLDRAAGRRGARR